MIRNLSLGQRIGLVFLLIGLLVLFSSSLGLIFASSVTRTISATESGLQQFDDLAQLERTWAQAAAIVDKMLLNRQTGGAVQQDLTNALADFNTSLTNLAGQTGLNERDQATVATLQLLGGQLTDLVEEITAVAADGRWSRAQVIRHTEMSSLQRRFDENLALFRTNIQTDVDMAIADSVQAQNVLRLIWIGTAILAAVVGTAVGLWVIRTITQPVDALIEQTHRVTQRDFREITPLDNQDEIGQLSRAFAGMTNLLRESYTELEQRVADRTNALLTSTQISRQLTTILDPAQLVHEVVTQIDAAFGYYHTHIYLVDDHKRYLLMASGTGEAGREMLARGHKIAWGQGLVGRAANSAAPVLVPDVSQAADWLPNPLLPDTKAETAVPIQVGQEVLGVLDVQHNVTGGLQQEDVDLLQSIANQVAIALRNAQLYAEAEKRGQREAQIRAINESILSTEDEAVALQVADMELGHAWGTKRRVVRLIGTENSADGAAAAAVEDALLRLPIRIGSEVIGELVITEDVNDLAEARGIAFVVAQQLGQHLEKLRLSATTRQALAEAQRRSRELAILNNIVTNLSAATSLQESMQIVVNEVATAVRVRQARIALFNEAADQLTIVAEHYDAAHAPSAMGQSIPLAGNLLTEQVVQTRHACYVPDARTSSLTQSFQEILLTQGIWGLAVIPIVIADRVAGTLGIDILDGDNGLSTEQLQLAEAIVLQAATAIEKARLFEQTEARAEELAVINEVAEIVSRQITQQDLLLTVYDQIRRIMSVDAFYVALYERPTGKIVYPLVYDDGRVYQQPTGFFNPANNIGKVIESGEALLINRTAEEIEALLLAQKSSRMIGNQSRPSASLLFVPLRIGQETLGVLSVQSYELNAYTPANITLLLGIANHVAVALDNARLLDESRKMARRAQMLRDISGSINTTLDAESILQTAVREIGRTLGLQTSVYLQDPDANGHQSLLAAEDEPQPA
ncbi:MAG: GAF domain-containing protein [Chloroflexi bacterium]|nr:GAF domain-containing protein [Chloroflexota bacterium]